MWGIWKKPETINNDQNGPQSQEKPKTEEHTEVSIAEIRKILDLTLDSIQHKTGARKKKSK